MKRILCSISLLLVSISVFGANYYLSSGGNDGNSGTSPFDAWQTIDQLNSISLLPGDSVLFECGSIFRGEIIIASGGTESAPIYFGKYGSGSLPVISGAGVVTGWSLYSGNTYQASSAESPANLFENDKQMTIARYPNTGFLHITDGIGNSGFVDTTLTQSNGYWNKANVKMRVNDRRWGMSTVDSFSSQTIALHSNVFDSIGNGFGYYFDNLFSEIDTANEWYYDSLSQNIFFIAPGFVDPSNLKVEASVLDNGIWIQNGAGYVVVENMFFEKQKFSAIKITSATEQISINHCNFRLQGGLGVSAPDGVAGLNVSHNTFKDINGLAVSLNNIHGGNISYNSISRIGMVPGYDFSSVNTMSAIELLNSDSIALTDNLIDTIGGMGIFLGTTNSEISRNVFRNCLNFVNELGCVYLFGFEENSCFFNHNMVLNMTQDISSLPPQREMLTAGIYLDAAAYENTLDSNTVAKAQEGIIIGRGCKENSLRGNLIYGCSESQLIFVEGDSLGTTAGNKVFSNVFYSINENSDIVKLSSRFHTFQPALFDSNYYFNPYAYHVLKTELGPNGYAFPTYYSLSQWQTVIGMNQNSHSTFFNRNRFSVLDSSSSNLISNSYFTNNFDGWISDASDTFDILLDNSTPLDFGCLKLVFVTSSPDTAYGVNTSGFEMDSWQLYQFHLSNYSTESGNVVIKSKENDNFKGDYVAPPQAFPFDNSRHDYDGFIIPSNTCLNCLLDFEINGLDSVVWLDNITLYKVSAILQVPEKKSRLFINASDSSVTFNLGDSIFFNLDQVSISTSITLDPYSSAVLIFDSSMIMYVHENVTSHSLKIFPNPVLRGGAINILIPQVSNDCEISICDLEGEKVFNKMVFAAKKNFEIRIPPFISTGAYFISAKNKYGVWSGKIVVQ